MSAGDEISFFIRSPTDAIKADMAATMRIVDETIKQIGGRTAEIKVAIDQASLNQVNAEIEKIKEGMRSISAGGGGGGAASIGGGGGDAGGDIAGGGGAGGNRLISSFIGFRATIRAIEIGVHGVEAGLAAWRVFMSDVNTEGDKIVKNVHTLTEAAREIPIVGNLLHSVIEATEQAGKAAGKALQDELDLSKRIAEHTEQRKKNELAANEEIRMAKARGDGPGAESAERARIEFERIQRTAEDKFQHGLLSGETKDEEIKAAAADRDRTIEENRVKEVNKANNEILHLANQFQEAKLEAAGKHDDAEKAHFVHSWEERIEEAFQKARATGNFGPLHILEGTRDSAVAAFTKEQQKKAEANEVRIEEEADRESERKQKANERIKEQQSKFEEAVIDRANRTLGRISEARARTTFEAVLGSRSSLTGSGVGIEDSVETEKKMLSQLELMNSKPQIVIKKF